MPRLLSFSYDETGSSHHGVTVVLFFLLVFAIIGTFHSVSSHANSGGGVIKLAYSGFCLDDRSSNSSNGAMVDTYRCNDTEAQSWIIDGVSIKHAGLCLSLNNAAMVELNSCDKGPNQAWLTYQGSLLNPDTGKCLSMPDGKTGRQLVAGDCKSGWSISAPYGCSSANPGDKIACIAISEWNNWNKAGSDHTALLNKYTSGAPYEEWCADFVSYVYKQAGYPFTAGETDGWDENNANNILNMGFTMHNPDHYTPKPGDVAYFN